MNIARYKKGFINTAEYDSKIHFDSIYCPDCGLAKVKLIRKANSPSYFEFTKDSGDHDELCPRFIKSIANAEIVRLLKSDNKKDMSRINFLVNKNLERSINLLYKVENGGRLNYEDILDLMPKKRKMIAENRIREYAKQNINSINAQDLSLAATHKGEYVVIYGEAGITVSDYNESKKVLFKANKDSRFSVFIAPNQLQYFDFAGGTRAKFAIFGRLKVTDKYINVEIRSTRDLVIRG